MSRAPALALRGLSKRFGGLQVIDSLDLEVPAGSRSALIGPNGAGKTTVFNLINGVYPVDAGSITVCGTDITRVPSRRRIRHGVARSFQNIRLVRHLTALENVMLGQHWRTGFASSLYPVRMLRQNVWRREAADALAGAGLNGCANAAVGALPYGVQKQIEVVRALLARPALLLLDEPAAGLNSAETAALTEQLHRIAEAGTTLLVVEHDMHFVDRLCNHVAVLNFGRKIAEGTPAEVRVHPEVREAYLGREAEDR